MKQSCRIFFNVQHLNSTMFSLMLKGLIGINTVIAVVIANHPKENSPVYDPPCFFNPLCICSKAYPDLGRVTCKNIPLLNIPQQINTSKVFALHLENNNLRYIEPYFFSQTGLFRIEISWNFLTKINEETFTGLERSLWELKLQHNKLMRIPNQSFRYLQKLKMLDLSGNEITQIKPEDWLGLEDSLKILLLSGNKLTSLGPRTFSKLQKLENLDLSGNTLFELDVLAFKDGPTLLNELNLSDNLFLTIPFQQISELRNLRHLDMSFNQITEIQDLSLDRSKKKSTSLLLDSLRLDYNQIQYLPAESFKSFPTLNRTYLSGNPITYVEVNAFQGSKIRELYLKDCKISHLKVNAFHGLEYYLEALDLEGNNLTSFPLQFLKDFDFLKSVNLKNNYFKEIDFDTLFDEYQTSLEHLDVSGLEKFKLNFHTLQKLSNLHSITVSELSQSSLSPEDFPEFLVALEEIKISNGNLKSLKSHAFKNVRGLKRLDLSENSISTLANDAFSEVGNSLTFLSFANGLSPSLTRLSPHVFNDLNSIELLDLSNNGLKVLPQKLFYSMKRLKIIQLQDNFIEIFPVKLFRANIHYELNSIMLSFNQVASVESLSFAGLNKLEKIWFNDNRIKKIEKKAFVNLEKLRHLYLRGNKITFLEEECFQDLPELEKLDLAYNNLKTFNYNCLEQVGTLSSFTLNLSHNKIEELTLNGTLYDFPNLAVMHINVKALDLSHNNISFIQKKFFKPIEPSITYLYISHNKLTNITKGTFGNMMHLQWLDISNNRLKNLEYDCFFNTKSIQVLHLSNNRLQEIPMHIFDDFHRLRVLDLSRNDLHVIPDNLFNDAVIEKLDISENHLTAFPVASFDVDSAEILSELDLSQNAITTVPSANIISKFKNLYYLNLSRNKIASIEGGTFSHLGRMRELDVSHNSNLTLDANGQSFYGLDDTLEVLLLKNVSLNAIPALHLRSLTTLDLSDNNIVTLPFEFTHNLSQLQKIELAENQMSVVPLAINALTKLQYLGIAGNPFESLKFQQSFSLTELDLRKLSLKILEKGTLGKIPLLENLKLSINESDHEINLPNLLKHNHGLKHIFIEILENGDTSLEDEMSGMFSAKLRNLTLFGFGWSTIPKNLLQGIRSPWLNLVLFNTSVEKLGEEVFGNAKNIRNITINVKSNKLKTMDNPNTAEFPNSPKKIFLKDLQILNNNWICDCSIGWIEGWERKKRQYLCENDLEECLLISDDLRSTTCSDREPQTVIEVFKTELECGWNSSKKNYPSFLLGILLINILFKYIFEVFL